MQIGKILSGTILLMLVGVVGPASAENIDKIDVPYFGDASCETVIEILKEKENKEGINDLLSTMRFWALGYMNGFRDAENIVSGGKQPLRDTSGIGSKEITKTIIEECYNDPSHTLNTAAFTAWMRLFMQK